jgi:hypothetical protein
VKIYAAFDNDTAGNAMVENLAWALGKRHIPERLLPGPGAKN